MKKFAFAVFFVLVFFLKIFPQNFYENYDGIPIIPFGWASVWYDGENGHHNYDFSKMKEMGADILIGEDIKLSMFSKMKNANLKIIPYQQDTTIPNFIAKYSEAAYTLWQAEGEGSDPNNEFTTMKHDPNNQGITELYYESGNLKGVITKPNELISQNSGLILNGPGYSQHTRYILESKEPRQYFTKFKLKLIETIPHSNPPLENDNRIICQIRVRGRNDTGFNQILSSQNITIKYLSTSSWTFNRIDYDLDNLPTESFSFVPLESSTINFRKSVFKILKYIDFEVYWYKVDGYRLAVDNVLCYDTRASQFLTGTSSLDDILSQINNTNETLQFLPQNDFQNTFVGWYAIDEPGFIDQMEPIRVLDSLIRNLTSNNMKLWISWAGCWNGSYSGWDLAPENVNTFKEMYKRSKINGAILNYYPYRLPVPSVMPLSLHETELNYMIENNLKKINKLDNNFVFSVQNGMWIRNDNIQVTPSSQQYNYLINLSLLFGAKGIDIMNYFEGEDQLVGGMYNHFPPVGPIHRELYYYTRDVISPRLKGLYGKTLRNISQTEQVPNINLETTTPDLIAGNHYLYKLSGIPLEAPYMHRVDAGFFKQSQSSTIPEYIMLVNRWYSSDSSIQVHLKNLSDYENWSVKNLIDTSFTYLSANQFDKASFEDIILPGEAALYEIFPVVKHGGKILVNETISTPQVLTGELTIENGAMLTINNSYNVYADITH